ncbi:MAG: prepilin-type N-terminal cleavage/methylation domain-containing protein [Oscillospiraceae bacterium]
MKNLLKKIRKSNKGFTLVELIIVIAIIAVLTAVLAPQYIKYVNQSRIAADDNTAATLLNEVQVAMVDAAVTADADALTGGGSITVDNDGAVADASVPAAVITALNTADPNWEQAATKQEGESFTINLTDTGATLTKSW